MLCTLSYLSTNITNPCSLSLCYSHLGTMNYEGPRSLAHHHLPFLNPTQQAPADELMAFSSSLFHVPTTIAIPLI